MCPLLIATLYFILQYTAPANSSEVGHYIILVPTVIHDHSKVSIGLSTVGYEENKQFQVILKKEQYDDKEGEVVNEKHRQSSDTRLVQFTVSSLDNEPYQFLIHDPDGSVQTTHVEVSKRPVFIFIQTDKPLYKPGDTVKFRVLVLNHLTRPIDSLKVINVQLKDSNSDLIRQWHYARLQKGVFQSQIDLANFVPLGNWTLKVSALNGIEETKTFNVAEYVLPLHEIHITASKQVQMNDEILKLIIDAKYTFGKPIIGYVTLAFNELNYPDMYEINGRAVISIPLSDIVDTDVGDDVYHLNVQVKIEEDESEQIYEASETIPIHKRSYKITLRKSSEYLLEEESIWCWLTITNPDGMPLTNRNVMTVKVTEMLGSRSNKHYSFQKEPDDEGVVSLKIDSSNTTDRLELEVTYEGETTKFEILHGSDNNNTRNDFIKASLLVQKPMLKHPVEVLVQSSFRMNLVIYYVISQGEILASGRISVNFKRTATFSYLATFPMVPEASLVVFTINDAMLWKDIVRFKVHELVNFVDIEISSNSAEPRAQIFLEVKSNPGSTIGLLAVDRSLLQLGTGNDITQQIVLEKLGKPKIDEDVELERLGFTVLTNAKSHFMASPLGSSPHLLTQRFGDDEELHLGQDMQADHGTRILRKNFPETWLWTEMIEVDDKGHVDITDIIPDTMTSWSISAFAINTNHGLGVVKNPVALTVLKPFFVTVNLPYSIVKTEQAVVEVFVHNYLNQAQHVTVRVQNAQKDFIHSDLEVSKTVFAPSNSVKTVTFALKPKRSGNLTVTILADCSLATDAIQRNLRVTPGGLQYFENSARFIEVQNSSMSFDPIKLVIPRTATYGSVSITFSVEGFLLGAALTNLDHIIRLPSGCGEQNMLNLVPSVIALEYMDNTDTLTYGIKAKAIDYLQKGYQNQLKYKLRDGSFSVFGQSDGRGSVFLTALVAKVFTFAKRHITIDNYVIEKAFNWLRERQLSDGRFVESGRIYYKELQSGVQDGTTLTAYTLIAFLEHKSLTQKYLSVVNKGTEYIAKTYRFDGNPYSLALIAYVLQLAGHPRKHYFFDKLVELSKINEDRTMRWWGSGSTSIETTAYVLLTYMSRGSYIDAKSIMRWMVSQRYDKGGYSNTQNTFVGLQALGKYSRVMSLSNQNYDVFVNYDSERQRLHMNSTTSLVGHKFNIPSDVRQVKVDVEGTGAGVFQIAHKYNNIAHDSVPRFKIEKTLFKIRSDGVANMTIQAIYRPKKDFEETNMVMIEVMFPNGYVVTNSQLKQLEKNNQIRRSETADGDTRLILYLDPMRPNNPVYVDVEAFRKSTVLNQAPGWIKVYDYYDPTREAIEYFDPISN